MAQRGRDAGAALGDDPASAVAEIAARVLSLVEGCDGRGETIAGQRLGRRRRHGGHGARPRGGFGAGRRPAVAVAEIAARVLPLVAACDGTELVTTIAGGMRLSDYLPTRTFELAVHTADLAVALVLPVDVPERSAEHALQIITDVAVGDGSAGRLLLAATGRRDIPGGFSVF